ncbi:hypothetical protein [Streptomyces sp. NBC_00102]|uniref:hypothetical protein n=1 Tax=Streptomyces sp. NBC_00102 TaxID=2975652 RepID=UPI002250BC54|nr:hypothetical protein [Streptomyces sp. NBC_00102]MCX5398465.1 hypothetical protein [Streptomyces sp. NBC_00102]
MSVHYTQTAVIVRAALVLDRYGSEVRDWTTATRTTVRRVAVQPDSSAETEGDRQGVTTGLRLVTRPGADIDLSPGDRVTVLGRLLEVDGEAARFTVAGRHHHTEVRLKAVSG